MNFKDIADHNMDGKNDTNELTAEQFNRLDRYSQFEKTFPFYLMDVNGFIFHVNEAILAYCQENHITQKHAIAMVDFVKLQNLQKVLAKYTAWSDLNNPQSKLVMFLQQTCKYEGDMRVKVSMNDVLLDEAKLKVMGILFCKGSNQERAMEFFDCILEGQDTIL